MKIFQPSIFGKLAVFFQGGYSEKLQKLPETLVFFLSFIINQPMYYMKSCSLLYTLTWDQKPKLSRMVSRHDIEATWKSTLPQKEIRTSDFWDRSVYSKIPKNLVGKKKQTKNQVYEALPKQRHQPFPSKKNWRRSSFSLIFCRHSKSNICRFWPKKLPEIHRFSSLMGCRSPPRSSSSCLREIPATGRILQVHDTNQLPSGLP